MICLKCGEELPKLYVNKLQVEKMRMKKYDISITYTGSSEIIVSQRLKEILDKNNITGVQYVPIYLLGKDNHVIEDYYNLRVQEGIGEITSPSIVDKGPKCPQCGFYKKFLCQTPLYFSRDTWNGNDICYTKDWFGQPPCAQGKWPIISPRLYRLLKENKIKLFSVMPAFFV